VAQVTYRPQITPDDVGDRGDPNLVEIARLQRERDEALAKVARLQETIDSICEASTESCKHKPKE
jgi:hypothetical protein